jgi:large subunit ribosomal protein L1
MARISKRKQAAREKVDPTKVYVIDEALHLVKELATARFPESIDISVNLGVDPRKSDQVVRGSTVLPNGTGKTIRVAVFAQGENADKAQAAGADIVGFEDLAEEVKNGKMDFDVVIATPDAMRVVGQLGQILGPRGLMPNPKVGTVTADVEGAVTNAKAGQVRYRTDKGGIIHCAIGRADFEVGALKENLNALLTDLKKSKPAASKGAFFRKLTVSSTMGPGVAVDRASIDA